MASSGNVRAMGVFRRLQMLQNSFEVWQGRLSYPKTPDPGKEKFCVPDASGVCGQPRPPVPGGYASPTR
jgi:hypothetical protein